MTSSRAGNVPLLSAAASVAHPASVIWVERSSSIKSFLSPRQTAAHRSTTMSCPGRARGCAPQDRPPHSTARRIVGIAHSGVVRVGRVRGRACAALRRGPTHLVRGAHVEASMALPLKCQHMAPRSLPVAGVTRRRGEPAAATRPRRAGAHGAWTLGHEAAARRARGPGSDSPPGQRGPTAHAPWACEAEGEGEPRWMQA